MKKSLISLFALILLLSFLTTTYASDNAPKSALNLTIQPLETYANNPDKINEALDSGLLAVSDHNPISTYMFDDGSYIQLTTNVEPKLTNKITTTTDNIPIWTASAELSAYSAVTGDTLLLWTYTLKQEYKTNGTKIIWHNSVPLTKFHSPIWSLWNLDSEVPGISENPDDKNGILTTSSIKCSYGIWEIKPQTANGLLKIHIKGNGSASSSATRW